MKLTSFSDYSLRMLMYLALRPGQRATIAEVAQAFDVSESHLTKVAHFLGRKGWVETVRGKGGGLQLVRKASDIGIGKVLRDTEGVAGPAECFSEGSLCVLEGVCQLKGALAQALAAFYETMDRFTLADLVSNGPALAARMRIVPI